jgi:hypothetical protein
MAHMLHLLLSRAASGSHGAHPTRDPRGKAANPYVPEIFERARTLAAFFCPLQMRRELPFKGL